MTKTAKCGCVVATDPASGVTRSYEKCPNHVEARRTQPTGERYYRSLGVLDVRGGVRSDHYEQELLDGITELPGPISPYPRALEVGGGLSPYVPMLTKAGYSYTLIEPDVWAAEETIRRFGGRHHVGLLEDVVTADSRMIGVFDLVLCCHALEHMADAPKAVLTLRDLLVPGGHLVVIVPDDSDLTNPDHLWFFTPESLYSVLTAAGLEVKTVQVRKVVERENFIYVVAGKPSC